LGLHRLWRIDIRTFLAAHTTTVGRKNVYRDEPTPKLGRGSHNATWANVARLAAACAVVVITTSPTPFGTNARTTNQTNGCNCEMEFMI